MKILNYKLLSFILLGIMNLTLNAQITKLQDYSNSSSVAIGTYKGINFREAGFSTLYPIAGTNGKEFWTCSDRGVNVDCANANTTNCRPTYDKMYAFPTYAPKIHRIRIDGINIQILQTITIKRPNGLTATGLINPTGLGSTALEVASTDTVLDCTNFTAKTAAKDTFGIDPEGLIVDKNGNFWLSEEGGATIWKLNASGILLQRYTPYANLPGVQSVDTQIDTVFKYRKNNRGFEGISIAPNGKIYAIIQSPILFPNTTIGEASRVHRILEIDPTTNAQRMLVYINDGIIGASGSNQIRLRDWKIGDMAAINDSTFLVLEAAARGTSDIKRLYQINIGQATAVHSGLYGTNTLEGLVDSTGLASYNIKPVTKTLVMDLLANGWPAVLDKAEGLAIINDSTIAIGNDNDFAQTCPLADGIPVATTNTSHVITFGLSGANKLVNYKIPAATTLFQGLSTGNNSSASPYVLPVASGVKLTSILTVPDSLPSGYKMAGIPDGLGAYDNGNGTFTLLMNQEIGNTLGAVRAHGSIGSFVSKWVINKSNLSVVSGSDLMQNVNLYDTATQSYITYNSANPSTKANFGRFCSADLPPISAFYNALTGKGTQERLFMNGEETNDESRAFAHIVTGTNAGTSWELAALGKGAWENGIASPSTGDKTVVALTNDGTDGQVYFYIGNKTNTGTEVDKAGLTNGTPWGVKVTGFAAERTSTTVINNPPVAGTRFTLVDLGNVKQMSGVAFNTASNTAGITKFSRPEDGAWDPSNPRDFYFNTTDQIDQVNDGVGTQIGRSRVWRLRFDSLNNPALGGTIEAVLDGTEGQVMLDNMVIDKTGHILLQEDVGNSAHNGKIWQYTIATDILKMIAKHDPARFGDIGLAATAPFNQDEETSGIIDVQDILGAGMFLTADQAHYAISGSAVEGGQLLSLFNPDSYNGINYKTIAQARTLTTDTVRVRGVITRAWGRFIYIQDSTSAIAVRQSSGAMVDSILSNGLKEGDFVEVVGGRGDYNNYAQINIGTGAFGENSRVTKLSSNNNLPAPVLVTVKQINTNGEQYESKVVRIVGLRTSATAATFAASTNNIVWDGATTGDTTLLRIIAAADTEIEDAPALSIPKGAFIFEGILAQFCSSPTNGCALGYQLYGVRKKDVIEMPLSAFNLANPANNSRIVTDSSSTSNVQVNWTKSTNAILYKWMLTSQAGTFTTPLLTLLSNNSGVDSTLTLSSGSVDAILAGLGINRGDSVNTKWTVFAYKSLTDSLQASQVFNLTLARSKVLLGSFNLNSPANNSSVTVEEGNTSLVNINWTKSANATRYKWFATTATGSFTTPLVRLNSNNAGVDTSLTLTSGAIDNLLNTLGVKRTDSVNLKWTVFAYLGTDSIKASQDWNITITRKRILGSFNLSNPANNARLVITPNSTTPIVIDWTASTKATKHTWKAATLAGNFSNPLLNLNADNTGADNKLTLTHNAIDAILIANGVAKGDSIKLQWTVFSYETTDSLKAVETFNIILVRGPGVGVNNIDFKNNINVYPNPAQTDLFINSNNITGNTNVKLYSITGQLLIEENMEASMTNKINVSNLQDGIYMLSIAGNNGKNATIKVVITH